MYVILHGVQCTVLHSGSDKSLGLLLFQGTGTVFVFVQVLIPALYYRSRRRQRALIPPEYFVHNTQYGVPIIVYRTVIPV
jgi:hypothetical protein